MGILHMIQDASPPNLTLTKTTGAPSFRAFAERWENENLDQRTAFTSGMG